jgi:hypothetical protein
MARPRLRLVLLGVAVGSIYAIALFWNAIMLRSMWELHLNDLGKFYYDARAFLDGLPMYGTSPATAIPLSETVTREFLNLNPPHFHLAMLPVAPLDPLPVLLIWLVTGLAAFALSVVLALRETGEIPSEDVLVLAALPVIASVAFTSILVTGQVTLHLLPLVTWAWIAARRGWWMQAGAAVGLAFSIKPFLLVLLPWLAVRGRLPAAALSLSVAACVFGAGVLVFGTANVAGWLSALGSIDWHDMPLNASLLSFLERALDQSFFYEPLARLPEAVPPLWLAGFGAIGLTSLGIAVLDRSPEAVDRAFTLLLLGAILMSPLGWIYYLPLALPPAIGLVRQARARRDPVARGERAAAGLRTAALVLGGALAFVPTPLTIVGDASWPRTLTLGSAHFWVVLFFWLAAVSDGRLALGRQGWSLARLRGALNSGLPLALGAKPAEVRPASSSS